MQNLLYTYLHICNCLLTASIGLYLYSFQEYYKVIKSESGSLIKNTFSLFVCQFIWMKDLMYLKLRHPWAKNSSTGLIVKNIE